MSFEVMPATMADVEDLALILQEAAAFKLSQGDTIWGRYAFTKDEAADIIAGGETYIARIDQQPAASVRLLWDDVRMWGPEKGADNQAAYIHRLATRNSFRGQGIGGRVLAWAGSRAQETGRPYLRLDCPAQNQKLCAYYLSQGFSFVGQEVRDNYAPAFFEKTI